MNVTPSSLPQHSYWLLEWGDQQQLLIVFIGSGTDENFIDAALATRWELPFLTLKTPLESLQISLMCLFQ